MRERNRVVGAGLALALLAALLCGCSREVNRVAERKIRDALPDVLGPARAYQAHIDGPGSGTLRGRLAAVSVDGLDVQLPDGLVVDRLHLTMRGVDVDTRAGRVRSVREATFTATIGENSLNEFLAGESPDNETIQHLRLTLLPGRVTLSAERIVLGLGVPFRFTGTLRPSSAGQIELDPSRLVVVGIPISGRPLQFLKRRLENGLALSALPAPVHISAIQMGRGALTLSGSVDVAGLIQQAGEARSR